MGRAGAPCLKGRLVANVQEIPDLKQITRRTDAAAVAEASYVQLDELLRTLSDQEWAAPTACPGWSVSDVAGHLIGAARGNASVREFARQQLLGFRGRRAHGGNPLDAVNALQIDDQARVPDAERAEVLRALAPDAVRGRMRLSAWAGAVRVPLSAGGSAAPGMPRSVSLGRLLDVVYTRDVWMHTIDIAEAAGREPPVTTPVNRRIVEDVVIDWVDRHRQPVELILTGPSGGHFRSGASGPVLELDAVDFCRTLSGRVEGQGLLETKILF